MKLSGVVITLISYTHPARPEQISSPTSSFRPIFDPIHDGFTATLRIGGLCEPSSRRRLRSFESASGTSRGIVNVTNSPLFAFARPPSSTNSYRKATVRVPAEAKG